MNLEYYFAERINQIAPKFELGKVYSNLSAFAFNVVNESKVKKLRIFDFDDTLAKVKANVIVKNQGKETVLRPAEFAVYDSKPGDTFDFREFNAVIKKAAPIQNNIKLLKSALNSPATKTTILTARLLGYPVKKYLKDQFNLNVYVVAVGGNDPMKKVHYIEKEIQKGYNDIIFIDDSIKNVNAVNSLKEKYPSVKLQTIHTTEAEHVSL